MDEQISHFDRCEVCLPLARAMVLRRNGYGQHSDKEPSTTELETTAHSVHEALSEPILLGAALAKVGKSDETILGLLEAGTDLDSVFAALVMGGAVERVFEGRVRRRIRKVFGLRTPYRVAIRERPT